jgi:hypothetical protein
MRGQLARPVLRGARVSNDPRLLDGMRFTVLKQIAKGISIPDANPDDPDDHPERLVESAK